MPQAMSSGDEDRFLDSLSIEQKLMILPHGTTIRRGSDDKWEVRTDDAYADSISIEWALRSVVRTILFPELLP